MPAPSEPQPWTAPTAPVPISATVTLPGSKSETNRALVLAALANGPSAISGGLEARDTRLMRDALRALGTEISETGNVWTIVPPERFTGGLTIDCGLAGTVMRFVPPVAALADGPVGFDGDPQAYDRPMEGLLAALAALGATVEADRMALPFTLSGRPDLAGGSVTLDASATSQYISGLLLAGARYREGIEIRHRGDAIPSLPHIEMTVAMLRRHGVSVEDRTTNHWRVEPGPIVAQDVIIEPDLSNALPFLAAAVLTGGTVRIPYWPTMSHQPEGQIRGVLQRFGARIWGDREALLVQGTGELHGVDVDLHDASELTPVVAAMAALGNHTTHIRGVAHIRGHETDRLAALETELDALGAHVSQTHDGLVIHPHILGGATWHTYGDHRMAQAGALLGLVVDDVVLDDVSCTDKTMPEFVTLWEKMLADSVVNEGLLERPS